MEQGMRVILAEDDPNLGTLIKDSLELKGFDVELYRDGEAAWSAFGKDAYDICLLDVMMPLKDGFTLAKEIRTVDKQVPIIFLTAKSMQEDKAEGFQIGADDYITKPFNFDELYLRIEAILRRTKTTTESDQSKFAIGKFEFDSMNRTLVAPDEEHKLTTKENGLLKLLCLHQNRTLERDVALKTVWGDDNYFTGRSMDVYVTKLRKYLRSDETIEIQNVHGTGFCLLVKA